MSTVLAANNFGDNLPQGQAGPLGLLVVVLLGIGCWFLYRSMSKHLRRLPSSFNPERFDEEGAWRPGTMRREDGAPGSDASAGPTADAPTGSVAGGEASKSAAVPEARRVPDAGPSRRSE